MPRAGLAAATVTEAGATLADHITVLSEALRQLPVSSLEGGWSQGPGRVDGAGATHALLDWLSGQRLAYSVGVGLPAHAADLLAKISDDVWQVAYDAGQPALPSLPSPPWRAPASSSAQRPVSSSRHLPRRPRSACQPETPLPRQPPTESGLSTMDFRAALIAMIGTLGADRRRANGR